MKYHPAHGDPWEVTIEPPSEGPYYTFTATSPDGDEVVSRIDAAYLWMRAVKDAVGEEIDERVATR